MNLATLNTFLAIEETGSLIRASERLHVSQSTVTARLQTLETELGQNLFIRNKSGVALTASGLKFKRYAEAMTDLWRQAQQETSLPDGINNVLNMGCHHDLWVLMGKKMLNHIRHQYPDTALSALPGKHKQLDKWMGAGLINAMLTWHSTHHDNQTVYELFREPLVLVSNRPDTSMRSDPHYIYVDFGEEFGRRHTAAYSDAGIAKTSFGCAVWALEFMQEQAGSAYLPLQLAQPYVDEGELFLIADAPVFYRQACLVVNNEASEDWYWLGDVVKYLQHG